MIGLLHARAEAKHGSGRTGSTTRVPNVQQIQPSSDIVPIVIFNEHLLVTLISTLHDADNTRTSLSQRTVYDFRHRVFENAIGLSIYINSIHDDHN